MNLIKKYKEYKDLNAPIDIVINSNYDYMNHSINVLKTCLNEWSKNDDINLPVRNTYFKYDWIFVNQNQDEKLYFIRTSKKELLRHKLDVLIDNEYVIANSYMPEDVRNSIYSKFTYYTSKAA